MFSHEDDDRVGDGSVYNYPPRFAWELYKQRHLGPGNSSSYIQVGNQKSKMTSDICLTPKQRGYAIRPKDPDTQFYTLKLTAEDEQVYIFLDAEEIYFTRFTDRYQQFEVLRTMGSYNFNEMAAWIHNQTTGAWTIRVFCHPEDRKDTLAFYFEREEDAALFKLFHI